MLTPLRAVPAPAADSPTLPHNLDAEAALLGAMMIDNRLAEDVQLKLRPEHFFEPVHGEIYAAILKLVDRAMLATPVTLRPMFADHPALAELGARRVDQKRPSAERRPKKPWAAGSATLPRSTRPSVM